MMKFGSSAQVAYGITPAASVSVGERLSFIKKVYALLALSLVTKPTIILPSVVTNP